jgi:hypothetical protein
MHAPNLTDNGDADERKHWPHLEDLIPHYQIFWVHYVYPLRAEGSIWIKRGLDLRFERLAIASYSTFKILARARQKIFQDHDEYRHLEELYMQLQRAAEVGVKLVRQYCEIETSFSHKRCSVSVVPIETLIESRLNAYRNLLHDALLAVPKGERGRMVPKPEMLSLYAEWSRVMFNFNSDDFVSAESQVKNDFYATASILESAWKDMTNGYEELARSHDFLSALQKGVSEEPPTTSVDISASGMFFLGAKDPSYFALKSFPITAGKKYRG